MLNIGQVVYDKTNGQVVIFAGLEICTDEPSRAAFIGKDGEITIENMPEERGYTNFIPKAEGDYDWRKIPTGSWIEKMGLQKQYFGIINWSVLTPEHKQWAKEAIEEFEERGWDFNEEGRPVLRDKR